MRLAMNLLREAAAYWGFPSSSKYFQPVGSLTATVSEMSRWVWNCKSQSSWNGSRWGSPANCKPKTNATSSGFIIIHGLAVLYFQLFIDSFLLGPRHKRTERLAQLLLVYKLSPLWQQKVSSEKSGFATEWNMPLHQQCCQCGKVPLNCPCVNNPS